ncbi:type II toxin-antitoxin system PemK/MazF family toxin [Mycobacterium sp.]|uniref:type II toxin-antitoxin system PemK/MazF family toxin n=1 Tax=Mycobacterium sp. TaxID=1785 RepID=UPI0012737499|nr:type II toxin-antitoxin system PemK/MazF family toxin [Mycobacterium sp.]KAA8967333.1 MAG: type II toxin-antitoxin system PemK/MazF family toxin [Mycobacterium sp.]
MASAGKSQRQTWQRFAANLVSLAVGEVPAVLRRLHDSVAAEQSIGPVIKQGIRRGIAQGLRLGIDLIAGSAPTPPTTITPGRPVTNRSVPTACRARTLVYAPDLDGPADSGEIVWTWLVHDDPTRGEDRPVLVVGRDQDTLLGLALSDRQQPAPGQQWVGIGSAGWARLDRVLDVPEESIRREGAILGREAFDVVAARLRADYSWR